MAGKIVATLLIMLCQLAVAPLYAASPLPDAVDFRYQMYPVKNQFFNGASTLFGCLAALEMSPGVPCLSEAYAYACLPLTDTVAHTVLPLKLAKKLLESRPMVDATVMPYESTIGSGLGVRDMNESNVIRFFHMFDSTKKASISSMAMYQAHDISVRAKYMISEDWLKRTIASGQVIVASLRINKNEWYIAGQTGIFLNNIFGKPVFDGAHVVAIVGYTAEREFVIRNSWGAKWGMNGYALMPADKFLQDLKEAMTIGSMSLVNVQVSAKAVSESFSIRAHPLPLANGFYAITFSFVLTKPLVSLSPISAIHYKINAGPTFVRLIEDWGNPQIIGFPIVVDGTRNTNFSICVTIQHVDGSTSSGCRTLSDVLSKESIVETPY